MDGENPATALRGYRRCALRWADLWLPLRGGIHALSRAGQFAGQDSH
ncbi:MAG: hypothetical protein ACOX1P_06425 [Thermoguttaceae bacterium]|jgi:hypothetical protein